jgi:hypothetical protein
LYNKENKALKDHTDALGEFGAKLDQDLGISKGLSGIADNLVRFLGNLIAAPELAKLNAIASAPGQAQGGFGLIGQLGAQGAFGPQYTAAGQAAASGGGSASAVGPAILQPNGQVAYAPSTSGVTTASAAASGGYSGDAALLAGVPAGSYSPPGSGAWDLTKGLGDCSSAVEDLVNIMDGRPTGGRSMATGNEAEWLQSHGFQQGMGGPGDFRVGFNSGHTQATLPGGTPFNWGSDAAAARGGVGGTGADDPAFTSHYYRPETAATAAGAPAPSAWGGPQGLPPGIVASGGNSPVFGANPQGPGLGGSATAGMPYGPMAGSGAGTQIGAAVAPPSGSGKGGIGIAPGGTLDTAMSLAAMAFPGAGQAAQTGAKLASRAIQFAGQAAGIGAQGLMETFLPTGGSKLASNNWITKIVGGLAGAAPALPNMAGKAAAPPPPGQGQQGAPPQGGDTNITVNNQRATEDGTGKDIAYHAQEMALPPGKP